MSENINFKLGQLDILQGDSLPTTLNNGDVCLGLYGESIDNPQGSAFYIKLDDKLLPITLAPGDEYAPLVGKGNGKVPSYESIIKLGSRENNPGELRIYGNTSYKNGYSSIKCRDEQVLNTTFYLPSYYNYDTYAVWTSAAEEYGSFYTPVYVTKDGRIAATSGVVMTASNQEFTGTKTFKDIICANKIHPYGAGTSIGNQNIPWDIIYASKIVFRDSYANHQTGLVTSFSLGSFGSTDLGQSEDTSASFANRYLSRLELGNSSTNTKEENIPHGRRGTIRLHDSGACCVDIYARPTMTVSNIKFFLPGGSGLINKESCYAVWSANESSAVGSLYNPVYINEKGQTIPCSSTKIIVKGQCKGSDGTITAETDAIVLDGTSDMYSSAQPSVLSLGNNISAQTGSVDDLLKSRYGQLNIYSQSTGHVSIRARTNLASEIIFFLPQQGNTTNKAYAVWADCANDTLEVGNQNIPIYIDGAGKVNACSGDFGISSSPWTNIHSIKHTFYGRYASAGGTETFFEAGSIDGYNTTSTGSKSATLTLGTDDDGDTENRYGAVKLYSPKTKFSIIKTQDDPSTNTYFFLPPTGIQESTQSTDPYYSYAVWTAKNSSTDTSIQEGSSTKPIYVNNQGKTVECNGVIVTSAAQSFSGAKTFTSTTSLAGCVKAEVVKDSSNTYDCSRLIISGTNYGSTHLGGRTELAWGDPGPQLIFDTNSSVNAQPLALIYTNYDNIVPGASLHLVSKNIANNADHDAWFVAPRIKATKSFVLTNTSYGSMSDSFPSNPVSGQIYFKLIS